ncbi:MAG: carboxypeptidase-like regulatory domain-containing protein [Acidobacteriota bacterium]|nr:carboxypeptidase-like regulatory domain-containing protein [Acidobacteriota bacterium]
MPPLSRKLAASLFLFALACVCVAALAPVSRRAAARVQTVSTRRNAEPHASVYGRAVYEGTSRPVRRARVMLVNTANARPELSGLTDGRGEFRIANVPAGSYFAFVDVPGAISPLSFVNVSELLQGSPDFSPALKFFDTFETDGKEDKQIAVHARRGAALSGRVVYADGDPAINVAVSVMRRGEDGRLVKFLTGANVVALSALHTDDRGAFRVAGLPPGEYVVAVSEAADHGDAGHARADGLGGVMEEFVNQQLLLTFYPSATSVKEATTLKLDAGDERSDVDITIPERELRNVSGYVRGRRDKQPVSHARVTIVRKDDETSQLSQGPLSTYLQEEYAQNVTTTDEEGRWQFKEIPEGHYTISVKPLDEYETSSDLIASDPTSYNAPVINANVTVTNANVTIVSNMNVGAYSPPRRKKGYAPARRDVEVSGSDVSEVAVELGDGGRISGSVTFEGGGPPRYGEIMVLRVPEGAGEEGGETVNSSPTRGGEFSIEGLPPGRFFLKPQLYSEDDGPIYVKSITWNGRDLLREPLEIGDGTVVEGVRVLLARNPAKLNVVVARAGDKRPAANLAVFLVPANVSEWSPYSQELFCSTGERGGCTINAPPGDYAVVALPRLKTPSSVEAEVKRRAATAPRVTLRAGESKDFEVAAPAEN